MQSKILTFAGSARRDSFNKKLIKIATDLVKRHEMDVTFIDLAAYPLPVYDGDLEEQSGLPENAHKLRDIFKSHQGILIASPEYNSSISPLLKNTIDWISRPQPDEPALICFKNKIFGLMSASPGGLGGLRGLVHVRSILGNIGGHVIPEQFALGNAMKQFNEHYELADESQLERIDVVVRQLIDTTRKLNII